MGRCSRVLLLLLLVATGCTKLERAQNPLPGVFRVAVLPFNNKTSGAAGVDPYLMTQLFASELQRVPTFEVVPPQEVLEVIGPVSVPTNQPELAYAIARALHAQAVIVGDITEYEAYYPPRLGLHCEMYAMVMGQPQAVVRTMPPERVGPLMALAPVAKGLHEGIKNSQGNGAPSLCPPAHPVQPDPNCADCEKSPHPPCVRGGANCPGCDACQQRSGADCGCANGVCPPNANGQCATCNSGDGTPTLRTGHNRPRDLAYLRAQAEANGCDCNSPGGVNGATKQGGVGGANRQSGSAGEKQDLSAASKEKRITGDGTSRQSGNRTGIGSTANADSSKAPGKRGDDSLQSTSVQSDGLDSAPTSEVLRVDGSAIAVRNGTIPDYQLTVHEFPYAVPIVEPWVIRHSRVFDGSNKGLATKLQSYYFFHDDLRGGQWVGYTQRMEDFNRFACNRMVYEMLKAAGGQWTTLRGIEIPQPWNPWPWQ